MILTEQQKNEINGLINGITFNKGGYNRIHQWIEALVDGELAKFRPSPPIASPAPHELHPYPVEPVGPEKVPDVKVE